MDGLTDRLEVSRLDVVDTGRRPRWTGEEKLRIMMGTSPARATIETRFDTLLRILSAQLPLEQAVSEKLARSIGRRMAREDFECRRTKPRDSTKLGSQRIFQAAQSDTREAIPRFS